MLRDARRFRYICCAVAFSLALLGVEAQSRKFIYALVPNAPPTTFVDASGKPTGFFVELFSRIMDELGIDYEYRVADFQELYPSLAAGEVDFFTTLQKAPDREGLFVFPESVGFSGWGQLFIANGSEIRSVLDLQHKSIGLVAGDQNGANFRTYIESMSIPCEIVEFADFEGLVRAVRSGAVFGGIQSNLFVAGEKRVQPTAVVFAPFRAYPVLSMKSDYAAKFDAMIDRCAELIADPDSYYYELQAKWLGGERVETVVTPTWLVGGFVGFFLIALISVLTIRRLTSRLRHANRELERRVSERTAQLVRAERMASLGTLAANIAHELNSPLQALRAGTDVLRATYGSDGICGLHRLSPDEMRALSLVLSRCRESLDYSFPHSAAAREYIRDRLTALGLRTDDAFVDLAADIGLYLPDAETAAILGGASDGFIQAVQEGSARIDILNAYDHSIDQMNSVIKALDLYASRDDKAETSVVSLAAQIDAVLALNADRFRTGIRVVRGYGSLPRYRCREEQLQQVWMNLVSNALEAMGGIGVLAISGAGSAEGVRIDFADTGSGIPPEIGGRVFEPFFTTKPPGTGTGLGLSVAQDVVRALGGSISFSSVPGNTVFTVRLPLEGLVEEPAHG